MTPRKKAEPRIVKEREIFSELVSEEQLFGANMDTLGDIRENLMSIQTDLNMALAHY